MLQRQTQGFLALDAFRCGRRNQPRGNEAAHEAIPDFVMQNRRGRIAQAGYSHCHVAAPITKRYIAPDRAGSPGFPAFHSAAPSFVAAALAVLAAVLRGVARLRDGLAGGDSSAIAVAVGLTALAAYVRVRAVWQAAPHPEAKAMFDGVIARRRQTGSDPFTSLVGVVRAEFLRARNFEYVKAARALGLSDAKIMYKHLLPNAMVATITMPSSRWKRDWLAARAAWSMPA